MHGFFAAWFVEQGKDELTEERVAQRLLEHFSWEAWTPTGEQVFSNLNAEAVPPLLCVA